jgi:lipoyl(octanoyl) transferase
MPLLIELGRVEYETGLKLQKEIWQKRVQGQIEDSLILLEHQPVITIGRRADKRNLLTSESELVRQGIRIYQVERGGDITYHGPGQLVGYPIFHLKAGLIGVKSFVENIEKALIQALRVFDIDASVQPKLIGVWAGGKKIASIGVAIKEGVSMHGFALNVKADLRGFNLINPCGLSADQMTSMEGVLPGQKITMPEVRSAVISGFEQVFGFVFQKNLPRSLTSLTNLVSSERISSASCSR